MSQPLLNIRLPTYLPGAHKWAGKNLKGLGNLPISLATTFGIVVYFLFLRVLRCFSSPGSRHISYVFRYGWWDMTLTGFPHSDIFGSKLVWQLPEAFRSLLRPSSVSYVQASIMCAWVTFYEKVLQQAKAHRKTCIWLVIGNYAVVSSKCHRHNQTITMSSIYLMSVQIFKLQNSSPRGFNAVVHTTHKTAWYFAWVYV